MISVPTHVHHWSVLCNPTTNLLLMDLHHLLCAEPPCALDALRALSSGTLTKAVLLLCYLTNIVKKLDPLEKGLFYYCGLRPWSQFSQARLQLWLFLANQLWWKHARRTLGFSQDMVLSFICSSILTPIIQHWVYVHPFVFGSIDHSRWDHSM